MKIYIMRHGEAGYSASSDAARTLTTYGRQQSEQMAIWLKSQGVSFDFSLVSPYIRAQQTLSAVGSIIPLPKAEVYKALTPGGSSSLVSDYLSVLAEQGVTSILVVSHLPLVGYLVNELCPSVSPPMFATATVACVELSPSGEGTLEWIHAAP